VPNQPLPEDLRCEGEFNFDAAADFVKNELEDDEFGLYAGLAVDPNGCGELTVSLERRAIAALLQQTPIDGYLAVQAWKLVHGV
jgi:hypothetical protein